MFSFGHSGSKASVVAPIGISFITFSAISYLADIRRGDADCKSLIDCALYLCFFPKVISGPIVLWKDFSPQCGAKKLTLDKAFEGVERIMTGFAKKLIIADTFGACIAKTAAAAIDVPTAWGVNLLFMFQLYFDFSGYSDIAVGLGKLLGYEMKENFNFPYLSTSITDFWRRWHISLGTWFKEYIYIPLGGSRKGKARTVINLAAVFLLTGLWHGASWTFVLWGLINGLFRILEKLAENSGLYKAIPSVVKWLVTTVIVYFCWIVFRFTDLKELSDWFGLMFSETADRSKRWTVRTEEYVNDRIGLRDEMILGYTLINDFAFNKMVHPSYSYGKDGYVFGAGIYTKNDFSDFHIKLADMIKQMQDYCEARSVPFLLVFDPAKPAVLRDKLPDKVNYTRECVDMFIKELDKRGIKYVDNTETLKKLQDSGTQVFNKKYDANHWNDTGAFYGTQNSLKELNKQDPRIHVNELSEFDIGENTQTTLPVSKFPINESVPVYTAKTEARDITESFKGLPLDSRYRHFVYTVNDRRKAEGSPRALIFQGSYINSYGRKYYENAFGECVEVHNYQNVLSFPQYYHLFDPQVVIFELAEYTMRQTYFDYKKLKSISFNDELSAHKDKTVSPPGFSESDVTFQTDQMYTTVTWKTKKTYAAVWLTLDKQYDMQKAENGYTAIVPTAEKEKAQLKVLCLERLDK